MDCWLAREAISASLDGEEPPVEIADLEAHLAECGRCRAWRESAHAVTRRARLAPARLVGDRGREVAAAVRAGAERRSRPHAVGLARIGLVVVAAAQAGITVPILVLGQDHEAPLHIAHEMGAFDMALAIGFLVAAVQPGRAIGMRALVGAAAGLLVLTAAIDLLAGRTDVGEEAPHLLAVAGWALLAYLAAVVPPTTVVTGRGVSSRLRAWLPAGSRDREDEGWDVERPAAAAAAAPIGQVAEVALGAARPERRAVVG